MGIIFYAFSIKDDTKLVHILSISNIFWMLHFFLLWNTWALIATVVAMIRLALSLKYRQSFIALGFVAFLSIFLWYFGYEGIISLIPIFATIIASYGFFFLEKISLRVLLWIVSVMWLYYHTQTGSISWIINEIIVLITLSLTIYRFIFDDEKYSYNLKTGEVIYSPKKRFSFLSSLKPKINARARLNLGRFVYLRDKDRFKSVE